MRDRDQDRDQERDRDEARGEEHAVDEMDDLKEMDQLDLTPEERMAFQRLPREAQPSRVLEERIVTSLREEGILDGRAASEGGATPAARRQRSGSGIHIRPWTLAGALAASLVLFASGVLLGHALGARSTTEAFIAVREQDATQLALRIQEAGSAYVSALAALGNLRPAGWSGENRDSLAAAGSPSSMAGLGLEQGTEVAMGTLYGAAFELARLDPGNADVLRILQILEDRRARETGTQDEARNVIWF